MITKQKLSQILFKSRNSKNYYRILINSSHTIINWNISHRNYQSIIILYTHCNKVVSMQSLITTLPISLLNLSFVWHNLNLPPNNIREGDLYHIIWNARFWSSKFSKGMYRYLVKIPNIANGWFTLTKCISRVHCTRNRVAFLVQFMNF